MNTRPHASPAAPAAAPEPAAGDERAWRDLNEQVSRLARSLEQSNLELRHNLASKAKMQAILISTLQSMTCGVLAVGQDGVVIVANPVACELFGRPVEELATRHVEQVLAGVEGAAQMLLTLQGAGGGRCRLEWQAESEGGRPRLIEMVAVRAMAPYDRDLAGLIVTEDLTRIRQLEQQATLQSRLTGMGQIATELAHEIRNPLGSMTLYATTLERELQKSDPSLGELASQIVGGIKALEHLVANTLEFTRPRRLTMTRVHLRQAVRETLEFLAHPIEQKGIEVRFDPELTPEATVAGDAEQLRQVLMNLVLNAIQAMEEGGRLTIEITPAGRGEWEVAVSDDGIGMPEEMLGQIFDPFMTTRDKGSGIGLSIVHKIVTAHEGRIEVESRVAAGTTFRVTLPEVREFEDI